MSPDNSQILSKSSLKKEIEKHRESLESIKEMGADVEAAEAIIDQIEKNLADDNVEMANTLLESATQTIKVIKQQYFIQASSILFSSLQRNIMNLEGAGSEVDYIKDLYNKAKDNFSQIVDNNKKAYCIYNGYDKEDYLDIDKNLNSRNNKLRIVYSGRLTKKSSPTFFFKVLLTFICGIIL